MRAIVDVPGDAVTPEVAAAWEEGCWPMADVLISEERGLYEAVRSPLIARGAPARDVQYEVFGTDLWLADFE